MTNPTQKKIVQIDVSTSVCFEKKCYYVAAPTVEGGLYYIGDKTYVLAFDSKLDDKVVTTTAKLSHGVLSVVKFAECHTRQTFCVNHWYAEQTFWGGQAIMTKNYTKKLDFAIFPEGGVIDVLYETWADNVSLGLTNVEYFIRCG